MKQYWTWILLVSLTGLLLFSNTILLGEALQLHWAISLLFALAFSLSTVSIIKLYPDWGAIFVAGVLDGVALYFKIPTSIGIYYGIYTFFVVIAMGAIERRLAGIDRVSSMREENVDSQKMQRLIELLSKDDNLNKVTARLRQGHNNADNKELVEIFENLVNKE